MGEVFIGDYTISEKLAESLRTLLEKGIDWERKPTMFPGVSIVRATSFEKSLTRLVFEINPVNESGKHHRKREFIISNPRELKEFRELLHGEKLD